ncbi:MAG: hypothetical protein [Wigfec virus K19_160]|nr:MAG: hypothetical protein [Wigfec virus K19_160]
MSTNPELTGELRLILSQILWSRFQIREGFRFVFVGNVERKSYTRWAASGKAYGSAKDGVMPTVRFRVEVELEEMDFEDAGECGTFLSELPDSRRSWLSGSGYISDGREERRK